jgi:hypothetical protein
MDMIDDDRQKARQLRAWLTSLNLPPRVINPLRRDLEIVLGEREGAPGKGLGLVGMDQAMFVAELYRAEGGAIRQLPAVGALVIEALREVIPPARAAAKSKPAAPPPAAPPPANEGWREFEIDDLVASPAAPAELVELPDIAPAELVEELPALTISADGLAAPADESLAPPRRRGRPRKHAKLVSGQTLQRRSPMGGDAAGAGASPPAPTTEAPAPPEPTVAPEPDESQLRQLWRELHPQGRRAVLGYISELLIR